MPNPIVNPAILVSPVENGYIAYEPAADRLHHLNPMAALLTELCDGDRNVDEIRGLVAPLMPEGKVGEVDRWVDEGIQTGLLVWDRGAAERYREFSLEELVAFAKRLGEKGDVQSAFLCWRRIVELKPDDADAWYELGEMALNIGNREAARVAYEKYMASRPEDAEIEHLLVALKDEPPPPRAPNKTIEQIYKGFANTYESRMLEDLRYQGHERVRDGIKAVIGEASELAVLDLGCGSGLSGVCLKPFASHMVGVDLSPEMIELARARKIYDRLEVAEITDWLDKAKEHFDIVAACDCMIYFGDLHPIAAAAANRLNQGGVFAISMERGDRYPFHLTDSGRYAHHPDHVREAAAAAGLTVEHLDEGFLRYEYGADVIAIYAVLRKAGGTSRLS